MGPGARRRGWFCAPPDPGFGVCSGNPAWTCWKPSPSTGRVSPATIWRPRVSGVQGEGPRALGWGPCGGGTGSSSPGRRLPCPKVGSYGLGIRSLCPGRWSPCRGTGPRALEWDPMLWDGTPCPGMGPHALAGHRADPSAADLAYGALAWDTLSRTPGGIIQPGAWPCLALNPPRTPVGSAQGGLSGCGCSWERLQAGARPSPGTRCSPGALKTGPGELQPFPRQDLGPSRLPPTTPSPLGPCWRVFRAGSARQHPTAHRHLRPPLRLRRGRPAAC